jgi:copper chaperone CopZ
LTGSTRLYRKVGDAAAKATAAKLKLAPHCRSGSGGLCSAVHPAEGGTPTKREIWNSAALVVGVLILAVGGPWLVHQMRSLPQGTLAARADQRVVTLEVGGMTCGGCAATVQAKLAEVPGVATAAVRYQERRAYVVCDKAVADSALTGMVARAGPGFMGAVVLK